MLENYRLPLVSIVIPTYKRSEKLSRAVKSVLKQTYTNIEVLVVSDNEPDDEYTKQAQEVVDSFNDKRVRLVTQAHHKNGAAARNAGIRASTGEYISFLDDDDFWDKEKIEIQVKELASLDATYAGVSSLNKIFKNGKLTHLQQGYRSGKLYKRILLRLLEVSTDTVLLRREALFDSGLYDETLLRHQEVQLFTFLTSKYKIHLIEKYLCNVDIDDSQNRPNHEKVKALKKAFLLSVKPITDQLSPFMRYSIKLINMFEVGGVYIKNGHFVTGLGYCLAVLSSPISTYCAIKKLTRRVKSKRLPNEYEGLTIDHFLKINNLEEV